MVTKMQKTILNKQIQKGFTLVELLIVVIILAILAAIVVPQFSSTTIDAKESALDSTLANMRGAMDLYYQQHNSRYPGAYLETTGLTATTSDAERLAAMKAQLTLYSDANGKTAATKTPTIKFGPYFKVADVPENPITGSNALVFQTTGTLGMTTASTALGWKYDVISGQFIADDATLDSGGAVKYSEH